MQISTNPPRLPTDDCFWRGSPQFYPDTTQTLQLHGSRHPGTLRVPQKDCALKQKDILHEDFRCAHQTSCMKHIVANLCSHQKTTEGSHRNGTYKWAISKIV